jgi:hypothetical protein
MLGLVRRRPLAGCLLALRALLAALRLTLSRALLPLTRGLPGGGVVEGVCLRWLNAQATEAEGVVRLGADCRPENACPSPQHGHGCGILSPVAAWSLASERASCEE